MLNSVCFAALKDTKEACERGRSKKNRVKKMEKKLFKKNYFFAKMQRNSFKKMNIGY